MLAFVAMVVETSGVYAVLAWVFSMIMGPYLYYQNVTVANMAILNGAKVSLQKDVSNLKGENRKLAYSIDELEGRVEDLLDVEEALEISFDELKERVNLNSKTVQVMDQRIKSRIVEAVITAICCSESNRSDDEISNICSNEERTMSEGDVATIIRSLNDVKGLSIHKDRLRQAFVGKPVYESIIDVLQHIFDESIGKNNFIFIQSLR